MRFSMFAGDELIVFGGTHNDEKFNAVHVLDLRDMAWREIETQGDAPMLRCVRSWPRYPRSLECT